MRKHLCATCHLSASWAIQETKPYAHIHLDATIERGTVNKHTFYCDTHIKEQPV